MNSFGRTFRLVFKNKQAFSSVRMFHSTNNVKNIYYSDSHEKIVVKNNIATLKLSKYVRKIMSHILYFEHNYKLNELVEKGESVCDIETIKARSEIYIPTTGKIVSMNEHIIEDQCNNHDFWIVKYEMTNYKDVKNLMTEQEYEKYIKEKYFTTYDI